MQRLVPWYDSAHHRNPPNVRVHPHLPEVILHCALPVECLIRRFYYPCFDAKCTRQHSVYTSMLHCMLPRCIPSVSYRDNPSSSSAASVKVYPGQPRHCSFCVDRHTHLFAPTLSSSRATNPGADQSKGIRASRGMQSCCLVQRTLQ